LNNALQAAPFPDPMIDTASMSTVSGKIGLDTTHTASGSAQQNLGQMSPLATPPFDLRRETLDEPVWDTIKRDLTKVGVKLKHVLLPGDHIKELRNWDLWGPLLLCLLLATTLSFKAADDQAALMFAAVFVIVWMGAFFVTINAALLGAQISFLQSVCVLGYCIAPLNIASILCYFSSNHIYQFIVVSVSFVWAVRASVGFMAALMVPERKLLAVYPVLLFYVTIGWMILLQ